MNKKIFISILLALILFAGISCAKKKKISRKRNINKENFIIQPQTDLVDFFRLHNYKNTNEIEEILGSNILKKASQKDISVNITTDKDSLITNCEIKAFNTIFDISKGKADSVLFDVIAKKPILKGNNLFQILTDFGMKPQDVGRYAWEMGEYIDARSINIGDTITVEYTLDTLKIKHFKKFTYIPDKIHIHEFYIQKDKKLKYNKITLPYQIHRRWAEGELTEENHSFDSAMKAQNIIPYIRQQANNALQSQISFSSDARVGDKFEILIEEVYVNGEQQRRGKVLYVKYSGKRAGTKYAYRFTDKNEASAFSGMYDKNGRRLVSNAVRTPLDNMHITSPFGYRIHPILGRRIFHHGIDLRGRTGTRVYAVSSGIVIKARNSGNGYGKEVRIRHSNGMITQYAHLSRILVRRGRRVRKGQLIGKVGSTGRSTGPHLHFGVMKNGKWVNPLTNLRMVGANRLKGARLTLFKKQIQSYLDEIIRLQTKKTHTDTLEIKS